MDHNRPIGETTYRVVGLLDQAIIGEGAVVITQP